MELFSRCRRDFARSPFRRRARRRINPRCLRHLCGFCVVNAYLVCTLYALSADKYFLFENSRAQAFVFYVLQIRVVPWHRKIVMPRCCIRGMHYGAMAHRECVFGKTRPPAGLAPRRPHRDAGLVRVAAGAAGPRRSRLRPALSEPGDQRRHRRHRQHQPALRRQRRPVRAGAQRQRDRGEPGSGHRDGLRRCRYRCDHLQLQQRHPGFAGRLDGVVRRSVLGRRQRVAVAQLGAAAHPGRGGLQRAQRRRTADQFRRRVRRLGLPRFRRRHRAGARRRQRRLHRRQRADHTARVRRERQQLGRMGAGRGVSRSGPDRHAQPQHLRRPAQRQRRFGAGGYRLQRLHHAGQRAGQHHPGPARLGRRRHRRRQRRSAVRP
ncbi:hypothetical protein [Lysobacter gummosus]|uniref:hypothetical protein n=1 Tax=Lysobacter gummosus TaxID=262324 RepID=UPI0036421CA8